MRDRTTILLEEAYEKVKEAAILPDESKVDKVMDILNKAQQLRQQGYSVKKTEQNAIKELALLNITIKDLEAPIGAGIVYNPINFYDTGRIVISRDLFKRYIDLPFSKSKVECKHREKVMRRLIGHEYIHQLQLIRKLKRIHSLNKPAGIYDNEERINSLKKLAGIYNNEVRYHSRHFDNKDPKFYYNNYNEIMTYAYEMAKKIYDKLNIDKYKARNFTKDQIYKVVQRFMQVDRFATNKMSKEIVQHLTPDNVKRYYKYIYDYVGQLYDGILKEPNNKVRDSLNEKGVIVSGRFYGQTIQDYVERFLPKHFKEKNKVNKEELLDFVKYIQDNIYKHIPVTRTKFSSKNVLPLLYLANKIMLSNPNLTSNAVYKQVLEFLYKEYTYHKKTQAVLKKGSKEAGIDIDI